MTKPLNTWDLGTKEVTTSNGVTVTAQITVRAFYDEGFELDWDFEPGEKEKLERRISSGDLTPCVVVVDAYADGETGSDSLGGCRLENSDVPPQVDEHGMIDCALNNLCTTLVGKATRLNKYSK